MAASTALKAPRTAKPATRTPSRTRPKARRASTAAPARPRTRPAAAPARPQTGWMLPVAAVGRTAVAVGGIADSGLVVRLTRGRLWIGLLGTLLVGIVGLNVVALSFSASSSGAAHQADELRRMNSALEAQVASLLSADELEQVAQKLNLVHPAPGAINYLKTSPEDAAVAAKRLRDGELTIGAAPTVTDTAVTDVPVTDPPATDPALAADSAVAPVDPATVDPTTGLPATDPTAAVPVETTETVAPAATVGGVPAP